MADALLFAGARTESRSRADVNWNFHLLLDLLAPALVLGIWRVWSSAMAPRLHMYFTAEALLIAYAYFSIVRGAHLNARSHDRAGRYSRELALQAGRDFNHALRRYWVKVALVVLPLLVAALILDTLTGNIGVQHRPNIHLTILLLEIMVWARYGAAVVIAAARWSPPAPAAFGAARELANTPSVARSFALTNIAFGAVAVVGVAAYKWGGPLLPSARVELFCSVGLFVGLALLALCLHCRWAMHIASRIADKPALVEPMSLMRQAA